MGKYDGGGEGFDAGGTAGGYGVGRAGLRLGRVGEGAVEGRVDRGGRDRRRGGRGNELLRDDLLL